MLFVWDGIWEGFRKSSQGFQVFAMQLKSKYLFDFPKLMNTALSWWSGLVMVFIGNTLPVYSAVGQVPLVMKTPEGAMLIVAYHSLFKLQENFSPLRHLIGHEFARKKNN